MNKYNKFEINRQKIKTFMVTQQRIKNFGESVENIDHRNVKAFCINDAILKALDQIDDEMIEDAINIEGNNASIQLESYKKDWNNYLDIQEIV